ncbi:MAG: PIN domain-containing protein [Haloarculaceae archaeon]
MSNIVVDSYAWVEYAEGSEEGERARSYVEGETALYTPAVVLAELSDRAARTDRRESWTATLGPFVRGHTTVVPLDADLADRAGQIKWEMRESSPEVGLADAIVLATAREHDARVLTGDPDFLVPALADEVIDVTATDG